MNNNKKRSFPMECPDEPAAKRQKIFRQSRCSCWLVSDLSALERSQIANKMAVSVKWPYVGAFFDITEASLKARYGAYLPSLQLCVHLLDEMAEQDVSIALFCKALEDPFIGLNSVATFIRSIAPDWTNPVQSADEKVDGNKVSKRIDPETLFSDLSAYREHIVDSKVTAKALHVILAEEKAIYGTDSRQDLYSISPDSSFQVQSKSIVSLWSVEKLKFEGDHVKLTTRAFDTVFSPEHQQPRKLDAGAVFYGQPQGAFGSGFLVGDDLIVTAAHCVVGAGVPPVADIRFVFGFKMVSQTDLAQVNKDDVYSGTLVDYRFNSATQEDWAVVRLSRKVQNHKPLEIELQPVAVNHPLYIIGHPCGLPMKVASGAQVLSVEEDWKYFKANLDSFGGNSGSPVFSAATSKVVGILVRGQADFIWDVSKNAMVAKVFPTTGPEGEEVTKITEVRLPENKNIVAAPQVAPVERRFQNLSLKVRHDLANEIATQLGKWKAIASYFSLRPDYIIAKVGDNELKCCHELVNMLAGKGVLVAELVKALTEYDMEGIVTTFNLKNLI